MTISEMLLPEFEDEMAKTRKVLEVVPFDDPDWRPHEKSMTIGRLAGHVAELPEWADNMLRHDSYNIEPGATGLFARSSNQALEKFDTSVAAARAALTAADDAHLEHPWTLFMHGQTLFTVPRVRALRNMSLNHLVHHRAQLGVYLRLKNIPVPGVYGPSADEK